MRNKMIIRIYSKNLFLFYGFNVVMFNTIFRMSIFSGLNIENILPNTLWIRKHFITIFGTLLQVHKKLPSFSRVFRRFYRISPKSLAYFCKYSCIFSSYAGFCPSPLPFGPLPALENVTKTLCKNIVKW